MITQQNLSFAIEQILRPIVVNAVEHVLDELKAATSKSEPTASRWEQGVQIAVEELGWKAQTVYQNIDKLPHRKLHGKLYFNREQLQNYIENEGLN